MEMLKLLFDWTELATYGTDVLAYSIMALAGTLLFLLRLALALFGGGDSDFDTDMDAGVDSDVSFTFFSLLSILAFFMGAGWTGLACRIDWSLGGLASAAISAGVGFGMMSLASGLMYATRKLNKQIDYDVSTAVGRTGRVYLTIPERGQGHGQVEVTVSGRRKIMTAISTGQGIDAFADVTIVEVQDDETMVVEPKHAPAPGNKNESDKGT